MKLNCPDNRLMDMAFLRKRSELKADELRDVELSIRKSLHPVSKCGDVFFLYKLTDLERRELQVRPDNPGYIAVIE